MENEWILDLKNGDVRDAGTTVSSVIKPEGKFDKTKMSYDRQRGVWSFGKNAFLPNELYQISVTVRYTIQDKFKQTYFAETENKYTFRTERPPEGGIFVITPREGYADTTLLNFKIGGLTSPHYPLSVVFESQQVTGTGNSVVSSEQFTPQFNKLATRENMLTFTDTLPPSNRVIAYVTDFYGQLAILKENVNIVRPPLTW